MADADVTAAAAQSAHPNRYKWIALSNTTIGVLMVTISGSITLISLPDIFKGIRLDPLGPGNTSYFLWMLMGFLLVTAVLVVSFGRIGDMYGRVKMYNLGFAVFTFFSILLSVTWMHGHGGALWLIIMRIFQGVGGAFLFANSSAILTDAFPQEQRGLALGINSVAAIAGSFLGLLIGGVLAPINWRLVFLVCVPIGLFGTVWAYLKLQDTGQRTAAKIDWAGNITFAVGLIAILTGMVYSIQPYGGRTMGWTNPGVIAALVGGILTLVTFGVIETKATDPMFRLPLFKIRAFSAGNVANLLGALGRGGIMFILILWLQGIWLPQHGYSFARTPLWAGIYMVPLTIGFLISGPVSGLLSDRYGARPFATGGMIAAAAAFYLLTILPINFAYTGFAAILLLLGLSMGVFASPNRAAVMNSLPPDQRGAGAGMMNTFQNASQVLSIGFFFALITIGMASSLPQRLSQSLQGQGVSSSLAHTVGATPPLDSLFSAFLGENPITTLNTQFHGAILAGRTPDQVAHLTGRGFFSGVLSQPFGTGLHYALFFAVICSLIAAVASLLRGKKYVHGQDEVSSPQTSAPSLVMSAAGPRLTDTLAAQPLNDREPVGVGVRSSAGPAGPGSAASTAPTGSVNGTGTSNDFTVAFNGHTANGHTANGHGVATNGSTANGHAMTANGQTANGDESHGHAAMAVDGSRDGHEGEALTPPASEPVLADGHRGNRPDAETVDGEASGSDSRTYTGVGSSLPAGPPPETEVVRGEPVPADDDVSELSVTLSFSWKTSPARRRRRRPS
ncbi:MAG: MFS transporter [Actinomycetota bacterium]|nr:MFS transporter [Actinomycetota bacterium]